MELAARIKIEHNIARFLIRTMKKHNWIVHAIDYGDGMMKMTDTKEVLDTAFNVDEIVIHFKNESAPFTRKDGTVGYDSHGVLLVFGNDGYDLIADYDYSDRNHFNDIMETEINPYTDAVAERAFK